MTEPNSTKTRLLYILDVLREYSDENHPLSSVDIAAYLKDYDIDLDRKTFYRYVEALRCKGYDIIDTYVPKKGYFLGEREFELAELRVLIDAIQSARFISKKKSLELTTKLKNFISHYQASDLNKNIYIDNRNKTDNEEIYYTIDAIHRAILNENKISLEYDKKIYSSGKTQIKEKTFILSPYALFWSGDMYYVVANNEKYDNLMHLRVDRIKKLKILDEPCRHFSEVSEYKYNFDVADYANKTFNAFGGTTTKVTLKCKNEAIDSCLDVFGSNVQIVPQNKDYFNLFVNVAVSKGFISSVLQLGDSVEVVYPESVRQQVANEAEKLYKIYSSDRNQ